jgi:hypothetical protein
LFPVLSAFCLQVAKALIYSLIWRISNRKKSKTFGARVSGEAPSKFTSIILQSVDIANMYSCTFFLEVPGSAIDFVTKNNNCLLKASNQRLQASYVSGWKSPITMNQLFPSSIVKNIS